jgi:hypothetical protein
MNPVKVSQSKVNTWRTCHKKYDYRYNQKLRKKRTKRPLVFGSIVHAMLEADIDGKDMFEVLEQHEKENRQLFINEAVEYGNLIEDIRNIMTDYLEHYKDDKVTYLKMDGQKSEFEFEIEIYPGIIMNGVIDALARYRGLRAVVDHKSFKRMPNEDARWRNLQGSIYLRAVEMLGWKPADGMLWNYIHSRPPSPLMLLKDGSISKKKVNTLPSVLKQKIKELGLRRIDHRDMIKSLEINRQNYFLRRFTPVSKNVVDQVFDDFTESAKQIAEFGDRFKSRNIGNHCSWCDYEGLCRAVLTGGDEDFLIKREYTVDEKASQSKADKPTTDEDD